MVRDILEEMFGPEIDGAGGIGQSVIAKYSKSLSCGGRW
jgi:hypothetical protein